MVAADTVRICAGGDVTLGTNLDSAWARRMAPLAPDPIAALRPPDSLVAPLRPLLADADVVLVNAEGAIGDAPDVEAKCVLGTRFCYLMRMPAAAAAALATLAAPPAVVVATVANNHAHDAGDAGYRATLEALDSAGVRVAGADTLPAVVPIGAGDTLAVLGFSAWSSPGVSDLDAVRRLVTRAAERYRWVIVTAHLGAEGVHAQHTRDAAEVYAGERRGNPVAFAHAAIDAGAILVIGHGPHVLRGVEWRRGRIIFYSLGNLLNYGPFDLHEPMQRGAIACATLDSTGAARDVVLRATRQVAPGAVGPDTSRVALALVATLSRADFPRTGATIDRVTGLLSPRRPPRAAPAASARPEGPAGRAMGRSAPPASPAEPPATASPHAPGDG
jgi:hypothetical protein